MSETETYPCADCGVSRTKAEGGATFTVCDECWDRSRRKEWAERHPQATETRKEEWVVQSERDDNVWRDCLGFGIATDAQEQFDNIARYRAEQRMRSTPFRVLHRVTVVTETVVPVPGETRDE